MILEKRENTPYLCFTTGHWPVIRSPYLAFKRYGGGKKQNKQTPLPAEAALAGGSTRMYMHLEYSAFRKEPILFL